MHDGYKKENHNDAISLISEIFYNLSPVSNFPKETLSSLPGMSPQNLASYEVQMKSNISSKTRQLSTKSLLEPIMGLEVSRLFQKSGSFVLNVGEKELLSKPDTDLHRGNILENDEAVNLESLYS